jgi:hypothetical protein
MEAKRLSMQADALAVRKTPKAQANNNKAADPPP